MCSGLFPSAYTSHTLGQDPVMLILPRDMAELWCDLSFFSPEVFDIPDVVWMVDDYWLSGCLEKNGVGIWLNADGKMSRGTDAGSSHSLTNFSLEDAGRAEASIACIAWFRERHGIW